MKLQGKLGEFPLPDILQFLSFGRKSGRLQLLDPLRSCAGELFFLEGDVVHAQAGAKAGEEAVLALLGCAEGTFEFRDLAEVPPRTVTVGINNLLLRAAQQMDETAAEMAPPEDEGEADIAGIKEKMKATVLARLGKKGKMALAAIDTAGDDIDGLLGACERIEKYVALFFDPALGEGLGRELREIVGF